MLRMKLTHTARQQFVKYDNDVRVTSIDHARSITRAIRQCDHLQFVENDHVDVDARAPHTNFDVREYFDGNVNKFEVVANLCVYVLYGDEVDDEDEIKMLFEHVRDVIVARKYVSQIQQIAERAIDDDRINDHSHFVESAICVIQNAMTS